MSDATKNKKITDKERGRELRKTHFTLGEGQKALKRSEYGKQFFGKSGERSLKVMKEQYHKNSHFKLGTAADKEAFGKMSDHYYRHHKQGHQAKALDQDHRASNFKLGNWVPRMRTTVNRQFYTKSSNGFTSELQNVKRNQMRIHNYKFGDKAIRNYSSNYNRKFNRSLKGGKRAKNKQELHEDALKLRSSNIVLGSDFPKSITEFQGKYDRKNEKHNRSVANPTQGCSNIEIGKQTNNFKTTFQDYFTKKASKRYGSNQNQKEDHFVTHFTVGTDKKYFQTLSQNTFKNPNIKKLPIVSKSLHASNFAVGIGGTYFNTSYNKSFSPFQKNSKGKKRYGEQKLRKSHINVGSLQNNYLTEFSKQFRNKKIQGAALDKNLLKDLRSSHFGFSDLPRPSFNPMTKSHFGRKQFPDMSLHNGYNHDKGIKRGKNTHFTTGNSLLSFNTSNNRVFNHKKGAKPARLDPGQEIMLKTHHFKVQDRDTRDATCNPSYRNNFPWKMQIDE